jgi:hypothetical protein
MATLHVLPLCSPASAPIKPGQTSEIAAEIVAPARYDTLEIDTEDAARVTVCGMTLNGQEQFAIMSEIPGVLFTRAPSAGVRMSFGTRDGKGGKIDGDLPAGAVVSLRVRNVSQQLLWLKARLVATRG